MIKFISYDDVGRILFSGEVPDGFLILQEGNVIAGEGDGLREYVFRGSVINRPVSTVTATQNAGKTILSNIVAGSVIHINQRQYVADSHACELDFTYPGTYKIRVEKFPYLDFSMEVIKP